MSTLKFKDLQKMDIKELGKKEKELKIELIKSKGNPTKGTTKAKEIKKIIARINTFKTMNEKAHLTKQKGEKHK